MRHDRPQHAAGSIIAKTDRGVDGFVLRQDVALPNGNKGHSADHHWARELSRVRLPQLPMVYGATPTFVGEAGMALNDDKRIAHRSGTQS